MALDALRQPLESGIITIQRAGATARFPGRVQLVLAANPCPCGKAGVRDTECVCTAMARRRYLGRLSGPLLDRIDLRLFVRRITTTRAAETVDPARRQTTAAAAKRVAAARGIAAERLVGTPWRRNADVPGPWLRGVGEGVRLPPRVTAPIDRALERGELTMRGYDRAIRVAWTIADLAGGSAPTLDQVHQAMTLRMAAAA